MNLFKHQEDIINYDTKKCGLFLGTGSGKTRIALLLARGRTLVIAPKTQVEDKNWEREAEKLGLQITLEVISKETFRRDHLLVKPADTVIIDECHSVLGLSPNTRQRKRVMIPKASQLYEAVEEYLERTQPERLYLCTATIVKSPFTVWAAAKLLGKIKGDIEEFYNFRSKYYVRLPIPGREIYSPKRDEVSKESLARIVRSFGYVGRLEDYFDVPKQTYITKYIELTAEQKKRIKELQLEYPDPIVLIGKKHQVENGVLNGDEYSKPELFKNGKIEKILELAEEFPRMVIFCKFTLQIACIESILKEKGYKVFVLTGDTKDRGSLLQEAKNTKKYIFIAQAQVSAGWELPECPVIVFASCTYSFVDYVQGLGRIQRADNIKKNLYIHLVVKGGTDEAVQKALENKCSFDEKLYV